MNGGRPLVSVVLNNYNYGALLPEAIDSALNQTYDRTEVVVVDDGSTDGSREVIERYGARVRAVLKENGGQASAFNEGFAASRGAIICLLDSDDIAWPDRVERLVEAFERWPRADWIRHRLAVVDAARRPLGPVVPRLRERGPVAPVPEQFVEGRVPALTSALAFRREIGARVFPIPTRVQAAGGAVSLVRDADAYLRYRLGAVGGWYGSLAAVLGEYRRHGAQQFGGRADLVPMLRRQTELARALTAAFGDVVARDLTPTTAFKHEAVIAALEGAPPWGAGRLGATLRGWRRALRLLPVSPPLALRQSLALGFALLLPGRWADGLLRREGLAGPS